MSIRLIRRFVTSFCRFSFKSELLYCYLRCITNTFETIRPVLVHVLLVRLSGSVNLAGTVVKTYTVTVLHRLTDLQLRVVVPKRNMAIKSSNESRTNCGPYVRIYQNRVEIVSFGLLVHGFFFCLLQKNCKKKNFVQENND